MIFDEYIQGIADQVDVTLNQLLETHPSHYSHLFEAAKYSLFSGGKRLRPLLVVAVAEAFGASRHLALKPACSLELVHTYSLIHDDLPCMDNDDYRRGKPTLHKVYTEGHAVLTGDFLLSLAFENLVSADELTAEQRIALISSLSKHAGGHGMLAGQVLDIAFTGKQIDLLTLQEIHKKKTAALITACFECGGIISNAPKEQIQTLTQVGEKLGLAFQIVDDLLDATTELDKSGKKRNSDAANGKVTYATVMSLEMAKIEALNLLESSQRLLNDLPIDSSHILELANRLVLRHK